MQHTLLTRTSKRSDTLTNGNIAPGWSISSIHIGAIQVSHNADGGGGMSNFPEKKRYKVVRLNIIRVTREWVGGQIPTKKPT